ncbi:hypothetical protein CEXT_25661 [Caerostris extrusa]|uniref:Uncharacterized protein n=1 Tax=Caerostris extrusa TaxID=172846 RepID=A0AAV4UQQ5_CAEEX|nr:hypothetical protein CEXT_25661 [Caerostris extrusa]
MLRIRHINRNSGRNPTELLLSTLIILISRNIDYHHNNLFRKMAQQLDITTLSEIDGIFFWKYALNEKLEVFLYNCSRFNPANLYNLVGGDGGVDGLYSSVTKSKESIETLLGCAEILIECLTTVAPKQW